MTTIGPLTGADARAYRQPPTAARTVPSAAKKRMKVNRSGRDTALLFLQLLDDGLRLRRFRGHGIGGDHFLERLDGRVFVAFVQLHERELEERLAPGGI